MLGISPDNVVAHHRDDAPSVDGESGVVLVRHRSDPTAAREGLDQVRVTPAGEDRYRVDYRGDRTGRLVVTRAGVAELGAALLGDPDPVPGWLLADPDARPWWTPDGYDGRPSAPCDRCGEQTAAADLLVPGQERGGDERFCRDCWATVRGDWSQQSVATDLAALVDDLTADDPATRWVAAESLPAAVEAAPEAALDVVPALAARATSDDPVVRAAAFAALGAAADDAPHRATPAADAAVDALDDSDDAVVEGAARTVAGIAAERPDAVFDAVPRVATQLGSGRTPAGPLVRTLERIGTAYPSAVLPTVDALLDHAESATTDARRSAESAREPEDEARAWHATGGCEPRGDAARGSRPADGSDSSGARATALTAVGRVAASHPVAVEQTVPRLTALFDDPDADVRATAARVVADVADHHPDAVAPAAERVVSLLDDDDETARREATSALAGVARTTPERIRAADAVDPLVRALAAETAGTRSNAAWLLGRIGASEARDALAARQRSDPATEVREAASWALDRLGDPVE